MIEIKANLDELKSVVDRLKDLIEQKKIVLLLGTLASGKTTFVKEYAFTLGIKDSITSPTFSLVQNYSDKISHYDIYNSSFEKFMELGFFEELENGQIHFIEWADEKLISMLDMYGFDYLKIEIEVLKNERIYKVSNE